VSALYAFVQRCSVVVYRLFGACWCMAPLKQFARTCCMLPSAYCTCVFAKNLDVQGMTEGQLDELSVSQLLALTDMVATTAAQALAWATSVTCVNGHDAAHDDPRLPSGSMNLHAREHVASALDAPGHADDRHSSVHASGVHVHIGTFLEGIALDGEDRLERRRQRKEGSRESGKKDGTVGPTSGLTRADAPIDCSPAPVDSCALGAASRASHVDLLAGHGAALGGAHHSLDLDIHNIERQCRSGAHAADGGGGCRVPPLPTSPHGPPHQPSQRHAMPQACISDGLLSAEGHAPHTACNVSATARSPSWRSEESPQLQSGKQVAANAAVSVSGPCSSLPTGLLLPSLGPLSSAVAVGRAPGGHGPKWQQEVTLFERVSIAAGSPLEGASSVAGATRLPHLYSPAPLGHALPCSNSRSGRRRPQVELPPLDELRSLHLSELTPTPPVLDHDLAWGDPRVSHAANITTDSSKQQRRSAQVAGSRDEVHLGASGVRTHLAPMSVDRPIRPDSPLVDNLSEACIHSPLV
jgi:hypothetical protein